MSERTGIEWTNSTWNPVTGCTKVSPGCANCYAEREFNRFYGRQEVPKRSGSPGTGSEMRRRNFTDVVCHHDRLEIPLHWHKPRRIFVCSMGDLFHGAVPESFVAKVFNVMRDCEQHIFQVLTKRAMRLRDMMQWWESGHNQFGWVEKSLPNVWLGVSCENQETADERIPVLLQTPAALRFVSIEPMLGPVNLHKPGPWDTWLQPCSYYCDHDEYGGGHRPKVGIDWVIVGGESGPKARGMHPDWARSVRDQCRAAGVPFFMKQMSHRDPIPPDLMIREFPGV